MSLQAKFVSAAFQTYIIFLYKELLISLILEVHLSSVLYKLNKKKVFKHATLKKEPNVKKLI